MLPLPLLYSLLLPCIHIIISLVPQLTDEVIQGYHDTHRPRMGEMNAFNMVRPFSSFWRCKGILSGAILVV